MTPELSIEDGEQALIEAYITSLVETRSAIASLHEAGW